MNGSEEIAGSQGIVATDRGSSVSVSVDLPSKVSLFISFSLFYWTNLFSIP
jgi:hypothetical protein